MIWRRGCQIDALRLRLEMERAFGGSDASGAWDWKLNYEACEVALVLFLRKFGRALLARSGSPAVLLPILAKVSSLLPTHTCSRSRPRFSATASCWTLMSRG